MKHLRNRDSPLQLLISWLPFPAALHSDLPVVNPFTKRPSEHSVDFEVPLFQSSEHLVPARADLFRHSYTIISNLTMKSYVYIIKY